jgi:hypothetical protein
LRLNVIYFGWNVVQIHLICYFIFKMGHILLKKKINISIFCLYNFLNFYIKLLNGCSLWTNEIYYSFGLRLNVIIELCVLQKIDYLNFLTKMISWYTLTLTYLYFYTTHNEHLSFVNPISSWVPYLYSTTCITLTYLHFYTTHPHNEGYILHWLWLGGSF